MKKLIILALVMVSINIQAAKIKIDYSESTLVGDYKALFEQALELQALSMESTPILKHDGVVGLDSIHIEKKIGQSELKAVRQLLHAHFGCNSGEENEITAELQNHSVDSTIFFDAFTVKGEETTTDFTYKLIQFSDKVRNISKKSGNKLYKVNYSGGGACEFGVDGFFILDKENSQGIMAYISWES
ncbi:MAG: hypothetical protein HOE90_02490 [Bacteriovoracaceae bacterium]|jgi:hypothetical protein|nr:hypothetical protein [Bacteriovoracaceae bacterium]